jgi:hypothetical protein
VRWFSSQRNELEFGRDHQHHQREHDHNGNALQRLTFDGHFGHANDEHVGHDRHIGHDEHDGHDGHHVDERHQRHDHGDQLVGRHQRLRILRRL